MTARRTEALERVVGAGTDSAEILRTAVATLASEPGISWAGVAFLENGDLTAGPSAGVPDEARRTSVPISFRGAFVGELSADGDVETGLLERIATLIASYVLTGWETGGADWDP